MWTTHTTYIWTLHGAGDQGVEDDGQPEKPATGPADHPDRGSQYASKAYRELLDQHGMVCSMSRKGNCWDNAPTECFLSSRKRE